MKTRILEATNGEQNWGKFLVGVFDDDEWAYRSVVDENAPLLRGRGISDNHFWLLDLQTMEGAMFRGGGYAPGDLDKHRVHVCVLYEAMLTELHARWPWQLDDLPALLDLPEVPAALYGYRRPGT